MGNLASLRNRTVVFLPALSLGLFLALAGTQEAQSSVLSLEKYRESVAEHDPAVRGAKLGASGAQLAAKGYESITDTQLIAEASAMDDETPTQNSSFQGNRTVSRTVGVGFQKQFLWGPSLKVTQNYVHKEILNATSTAVPEPDYYDAFPQIELAIPLWRNFAGSQTQAHFESLKAKTQADVYRSDAALTEALGQVDLTYYEHAAHLEQVQIQKEILERSERLLRWVKGQFTRGLVDKSDVHQAEAAVTLRKIELQNVEDAAKASARAFNSKRGVRSDIVPEKLVVNELDLTQLGLSKDKIRKRKDLLANEELTRIQEQDFIDKKEQAKPKLDLTVKGARTGRDPSFYDAVDESWERNQNIWYIGVSFAAPIDAPKYLRLRRGFSELAQSYELQNQAQGRERVLAWESFVDLGQRLQKQIQLLRELEETQKAKAESEQTRFSRGRSTTFQVLTFEKDYHSARSQRISAELEARRYLAQVPQFIQSGEL